LFEMMDSKGTGSVEIAQFCDELVRVVTTDKPLDQVLMMKQMGTIKSDVRRIDRNVQMMESRVNAKLDSLQQEFREVFHNIATKSVRSCEI